jgi:hypothetical protein
LSRTSTPYFVRSEKDKSTVDFSLSLNSFHCARLAENKFKIGLNYYLQVSYIAKNISNVHI